MVKAFDVIIIGGGASGLMCALTAGQRGRSVLVLEHTKRVGKKILMSGGGRCNFTNYEVDASHYICGNPHFCKSALRRYTQWDFIGLVEKHGIAYHERDHGQLFCNDSAKQILAMLLDECEQVGVEIRTMSEVYEIDSKDDYRLKTATGDYQATSLVIATGGLSIPTMGSSGFGYQVAQQFGLKTLTTRAGLVPFTFSDWFKPVTESLSGTAIWVTMSCGERRFSENILFTHRGLSGPAVLQLSNYWQPGESISIDFFPNDDAVRLLTSWKQTHPKSLLRSLLSQHLPKKLVRHFIQQYWPTIEETPLAEISDKQLNQVAEMLHDLRLKPAGTEGYRTAEVTLGGVDTDEISSKTMESKKQPGLYFIGEVLDVTGWLGGYNFQWAWASGYAAGQVA